MSASPPTNRPLAVTVLAGGVGAARFLRGLRSLLDPTRLTVVVNTGDDETFYGLHVSPDLDTVTYTLAGVVHPKREWGVRGDGFTCLKSLERYYGPAWFQLGDRDLATHVYRTDLLRQGVPLSAVTTRIAARLGVAQHVLPMSDDSVRTFVTTKEGGRQAFQEYLVHGRGRGAVTAVTLQGAARARPAPGVLRALRSADAIILPPSNPIVSIGPILALRGVRAALRRARAPIAAISPIVGGAPIKGPAHRMLAGLGHEVSPLGVARLYADFASIFVLDERDHAYAPAIADLGLRPVVTDTIMRNPARAAALAARVLREVQS